MRKYPSLLIFVFFIDGFTACGQKTFDEKMQSLYRGTVPLIMAEEVKSKKEGTYYLLDTRSQREFEVSHLPGAMFIDYDAFSEKDVSDIPTDAEVIIYCSVGYRSERIGEALQKMGYINVKNLYGGIFDWKNKGNQVVNATGQPTDSVHTYNARWSQWLYNGVKIYE